MNVKTWLPLCLSLLIGGVVCKLAYDQMNKTKVEVVSGNTTQIVVAKRAIGAGEELSNENCTMKALPADVTPDNAFHSMDELKGRVSGMLMSKNQAITETSLAMKGAGAGLQGIITPGMRAVTIEINEFSGVGGMLMPGCHVDILSTVPGEQGGEMVSRTIVQNVSILSVGQRMVQQPDKKDGEPVAFRSVTLLASPTEAEAIELAAANGRPRLILRAGNDTAMTTTTGVTVSNLRGQSVPKPDTQTARVTFPTVKIIRGGIESEVRMDIAGYEAARMAKSTEKPATDKTASDKPATDKPVTANDTGTVHQ